MDTSGQQPAPAEDAGHALPGHSGPARSLAELEERVRYDLDCLKYPNRSWVPTLRVPSGVTATNVLVVGAGQGGLSVALALRLACIDAVTVIDRAPSGREGAWATFARMPHLRTPKYLTGPDCGIPSLTPRAWYEAKHGPTAWSALERFPTAAWAEYLDWLKSTAEIAVDSGSELVNLGPGPQGLVQCRIVTPAGEKEVLARKVVLATGMDGGGAWTAPEGLTRSLPRDRWFHAADPIDFGALAGLRVAVLGFGASALDNAITALEAGAARVDVFARRPPQAALGDVRGWLENVGFLSAYSRLTDSQKWSLMERMLGAGAPPPLWTLETFNRMPGAHIHPGVGWTAARMRDGHVLIETATGEHVADAVIFGTGISTDLRLRPELAGCAGLIQTWGDRFDPGPDSECRQLLRWPYLGEGMQLLEKAPSDAPWLGRIHLANFAATATLGLVAASITGMKFGLQRLVPAIVSDLYVETASSHVGAMPWRGVI